MNKSLFTIIVLLMVLITSYSALSGHATAVTSCVNGSYQLTQELYAPNVDIYHAQHPMDSIHLQPYLKR